MRRHEGYRFLACPSMQTIDFPFQSGFFTSIIKGFGEAMRRSIMTLQTDPQPPTGFENCIEGIMSDAHNEHESAIKTPKQLVAAIAAGFLVPIICIVLLVQYVANTEKAGAGSDGLTDKAIAARLKPVADEGFTLKDVNAPKQLQAGNVVYKATCAACHDTGAAGAPRLGDAGSWAARLGKGQATVVANAIKGLGAMPAKGGNPDLDDIEVERAVVYMVSKSGGDFKEPAAPPPPTAAAAGAAAQ